MAPKKPTPAPKKPTPRPARPAAASAKSTTTPIPSPPAVEVTGQHGGAREGAGRKRAALPTATLERLGPPPADSPLKMARWWSRVIAELGWLVATGEVGTGIVLQLKGLAGAASRLVPEDLRAEVDRYLKSLEAAAKPEAQGPKPEEPKHEQPPLRATPR